MKTVRRLLYADIAWSVVFVALAFLSLMFFIDVVDELGDLGQRGHTAARAFLYSLLQLPRHLYELAPIAVLIGTIYALANLAQSSEYTILRTGGLGPARALALLGALGVYFALVTFVVGDYLAPLSERGASRLRALARGDIELGRSGVWLRDRGALGDRSYAVRIGGAQGAGLLRDVRIYEFGGDGQLLQRIQAAAARVDTESRWTLEEATVSTWPDPGAAAPDAAAVERQHPSLVWHSGLSPAVVAAAVLPSSTMSTFELRRYIDHLSLNEQAAQQHKITFWKRALYPFACLVMIALALPFAYLRARSGGVTLKVFGGIVLGISFVLLNNASGHLGLLRGWTPWIAAAVPSAIYLALSLGAFAWLVRFR